LEGLQHLAVIPGFGAARQMEFLAADRFEQIFNTFFRIDKNPR
jgi:hypothetical protein